MLILPKPKMKSFGYFVQSLSKKKKYLKKQNSINLYKKIGKNFSLKEFLKVIFSSNASLLYSLYQIKILALFMRYYMKIFYQDKIDAAHFKTHTHAN
ncbi:Protein of unknown function [Gryllus bimaculatus]|nr:Protein of unknown function [Gryllus bimaculatus]